jgi:hypothetical protein
VKLRYTKFSSFCPHSKTIAKQILFLILDKGGGEYLRKTNNVNAMANNKNKVVDNKINNDNSNEQLSHAILQEHEREKEFVSSSQYQAILEFYQENSVVIQAVYIIILMLTFLLSGFDLFALFIAGILGAFFIALMLFIGGFSIKIQKDQKILDNLEQIQQNLNNKSSIKNAFNKNKKTEEFVNWNGFRILITASGIIVFLKDGTRLKLSSMNQLKTYILSNGNLNKVIATTAIGESKPVMLGASGATIGTAGVLGKKALNKQTKKEIELQKKQQKAQAGQQAGQSQQEIDNDIVLKKGNKEPDLRHCIGIQLSEEEKARAEIANKSRELANQKIMEAKEKAIEDALKDINEAQKKGVDLANSKQVENLIKETEARDRAEREAKQTKMNMGQDARFGQGSTENLADKNLSAKEAIERIKKMTGVGVGAEDRQLVGGQDKGVGRGGEEGQGKEEEVGRGTEKEKESEKAKTNEIGKIAEVKGERERENKYSKKIKTKETNLEKQDLDKLNNEFDNQETKILNETEKQLSIEETKELDVLDRELNNDIQVENPTTISPLNIENTKLDKLSRELEEERNLDILDQELNKTPKKAVSPKELKSISKNQNEINK